MGRGHALLAVIYFFAFAAHAKTAGQIWANAGLSSQLIVHSAEYFGFSECAFDVDGFVGCAAAVNAIGRLGDPQIRFVPNSLLKDSSMNFGAVIESLPGFSLVLVKSQKSNLTARQSYLNERDRRLHEREAFSQAYQAKSDVDFRSLIDDVLQRTGAAHDREKNALAMANAMNAYYSTAVDPHSKLDVDSEDVIPGKQNISGQTRFGLRLAQQQRQTVLAEVFEGSQAEQLGLQENDVVKSIDGSAVDGVDLDKAASSLSEGSSQAHKIQVLRNGQTLQVSYQFDRKLSEKPVNKVRSQLINDFGQTVGWVRVDDLMDINACDEIKAALAGKLKTAQALVLDLRGNPGGYQPVAVCIAAIFVGERPIVEDRKLQGAKKTTLLLGQGDQFSDLPLSILIDGGSASGSEIIAGALQDYERAWIVGERSFGKGSVQTLNASDSFFGLPTVHVWLTTDRFYLPSGRSNQLVGIHPDFEVAARPGMTDDQRFVMREAEKYPNAIEAGDHAKWSETRSTDVANINQCAQTMKVTADSLYTQATAKGLPIDYQLLRAEQVLHCAPSETKSQIAIL